MAGVPPRDTTPAAASRDRPLLLAGAILLLAAVAYGPALRYDYVQDALPAVASNPVVERGDLVEIFASDYWKDTASPAHTLYRPLTVLSFALERRLAGGAKPLVSHLLNVLLHALAALALAFYLRRLQASPAAAALAALAFAVHPVLLQGVVNVVGRADILALLFGLAALSAFRSSGRAAPWLGGLFVFLALGAKEIALAFPALIVAQELLVERSAPGGRIERAARLAPVALALFVYLVLRTSAIEAFPGLQPIAPEDNVLLGLTGTPRLATALALAARYAGLLVAPLRLSGDYSGGAIAIERSLWSPRPLFGLVVLLGLAGAAAAPALAALCGASARRRCGARRLALAALLFLLPYLVIGNLVVLNAAGFAERLIYVPAAGFCALVGLGLAALFDARRLPRVARRVGQAACGALCVLAALHTREASRMWESNRALFERSLAATPDSLRAAIALAQAAEQLGRADEALALYERMMRHSPEYGGSWLARGILLAQRGDLAGAEAALRHALWLRPDVGEVQAYLGLVLSRTGRPAEAERALRKALLLAPLQTKAAAQLAHLLFQSGRYAEAAHYYRGCVRLGREDLRRQLAEAERRAATAAPAGAAGFPHAPRRRR